MVRCDHCPVDLHCSTSTEPVSRFWMQDFTQRNSFSCGRLSPKESCVKGIVTDVWWWHLVGGFRSLGDALYGDYRLSPHLSLCIPIVEEWLNSYHVALAMIYCLPNSSKDRSQSVRSWGCQMVSPDEPYLFLSWLSPAFSYSIDKPTHSSFPSYLQSTQKMSRKRKREGQKG